ncbi:hypothetical protein AOLI_G00064380 [Acnodon oligacanthus]
MLCTFVVGGGDAEKLPCATPTPPFEGIRVGDHTATTHPCSGADVVSPHVHSALISALPVTPAPALVQSGCPGGSRSCEAAQLFPLPDFISLPIDAQLAGPVFTLAGFGL